MSFVVIAVLIVLTALAVGYVGLLLEEHAEWRGMARTTGHGIRTLSIGIRGA